MNTGENVDQRLELLNVANDYCGVRLVSALLET